MEIRFTLFFVVTLFACNRQAPFYEAPRELDSLVREFVMEARIRGVHIDPSKDALKVQFGLMNPDKSGSCKPNSYPKIVTIDSIQWKYTSSSLKEFLVFHELAHCLLNRAHNNLRLGLNDCKSWMRESDTICSINVTNRKWRRYYLDELFGEDVARPEWYSSTQKSVSLEDKEILHTTKFEPHTAGEIFDPEFLNSIEDWAIRIECLNSEITDGSLGLSINEIALEWGYSRSYFMQDPKVYLHKKIMVNTGYRINSYQVLWSETRSSASDKTRVVIQKNNNVLYIFFDAELKLCLPVEGTVSISGYSSFDDSYYSIDLYKL